MRLESHGPTDMELTLRALPFLHDPDLGVIQSLDWYFGQYDEPHFWHCTARLGDVGKVTGVRANTVTGGTALDRTTALVTAIGESVERYCSDIADREAVVVGSAADLGVQAVDPRRFALFHPRQYASAGFPFEPVTRKSPLSWVEGFSLTRGEPALVPAVLVHLPFAARTRADTFELGPVSGYAAGATLEEAILGGICEIVERDAFMVFWRNWLPVPGIDLGTLSSAAARQTLARYSGVPAQIFCSSITTDLGIPAVLATLVNHTPTGPAAVVATAAALDVERAISHVLLELAANHLLVRSQFEQHAGTWSGSPWDVEQPEDHGLLYASTELLPWLDTLLRPRWMVSPRDFRQHTTTDVKQDVEECVRRLAARGLEVLVVDLTSPDVSELDLRVVKVLVPGSLPIDFGVRWPHLGGRRLYEAPRWMGYTGRLARDPAELNLFPHPFP